MTNADKFKSLFGLYATELWAMPEKDFLKWLNSEAMNCSEFPNNSDTISRQAAIEALAKQMPTPYTPDGSHPADEGIFQVQEVYADCIETLELLPPAQPEERTKKRTETHECD